MFLTNNEDDLQQYLKQKQNKYYVYLLIDPDTNLPFYVGKGKNLRCLQHKKDALNKKYPHRSVHRKIQSILRFHKLVLYNIINFYETEDQAFDVEKQLIEQYGRKDKDRGILCNLTEGGDSGPSQLGKKRTEQTIQKIIADRQKRRNKGIIHNTKTRNTISKKLKGRSKNMNSVEQIKQKLSIPICQIDPHNNTIINCFENAQQAAQYIGLKSANLIRMCCDGKREYVNGFKWVKGICLINHLNPYNRKIVQYTLQGVKVAEYSTGKQAAIQCNCSASGIYNCCRGLTKTYMGFIWKYEYTQTRKTRKTTKKVAKCDLNGNILNIYDSVPQAAHENNMRSTSAIYACCKQQIKQLNGFIWKFI